MTAGGPNLGLRATGIFALALLLTASMATLIFPIIAGVLKLSMTPGVTSFDALTAWSGFVFGAKGQPAHWFAFWFHLKLYLLGVGT